MRLLGDPLRLDQILIDCVTNAVKFTAQGEVCVKVRLASTEAQHCLVVFEVVDTGISLDLSICKGLAQLMGGSVGVDSQPGHGSTFWFTARLGLPHLAEDRPDPSGDPALLLGPVRGARILVVEDNLINQQVASEMLASQGLAVVLADDGQAALDAIAGSHQQEQAFDLVLMDLQMPGMDGLTALAHLRADGRNATLPVVALTANVVQEEREACANAGMNGFVGKPIDARVFWQALRQLIQPRVGLGLAQPGRPAVAHRTDSADPAAVLEQLSGSPEINVDLGLRRVIGRAELYVSLLCKFVDTHRLDLQAIAAAIGQNDPANARRFAHTLKSVAGNIGATRQMFAASVLEACLQTPGSQAAVEARLADVRDLLDALCARLQQGLGTSAAHPVSFAVGDTSAPFSATPSAPHASNPGEALAVCLQRKALLNAMAAFDFELAGQILDRGPLHRFGMSPS